MSDNVPDARQFAGMTVNERLGVAGLFKEWDAAALARDRDAMIAVLRRVAFSERSAAATTDAVLKNPAHYGF